METKALPPAKINTQKLLGGSSISSTVKSINQNPSNESEKIFIIKNQVLDIEKILSTNVLLNKKELERKRKSKERDKFQKKEEKLENKKENGIVGRMNLPQVPNLGFLDRIKQFLFKLILGKIAITLLPHLPKLAGVVSIIDSIQNTLIDWGGKILNGLVSFVDKGYETYDKSRKLISDFGGNKLLKLFDGFNGAVGKIIEASIIAALAFGELGGDGGGSGGSNRSSGPLKSGKELYKEYDRKRELLRKNHGDAAARIYDNEIANGRTPKNAFTNVKNRYIKTGRITSTRTLGLGEIKGSKLFGRGIEKVPTRLLTKILGKKAVLGFVRPFLKRLPIIGALIDFGLSVALGENPGRAAFKAIGAALFGSIGAAAGSVVPFAGTILGGLAGGALGDLAGGALYDVFFGNKSPQKQKVEGRAQGGRVRSRSTRGGKLDIGPKRSVEKSVKRQVKTTPTQLKPGSDVGGEKKVEKMFPKTETTDNRVINPLGYIKNAYKIASGVNYFGPVFSLVLKKLSGDKIGKVDYDNVGYGLGAWMNNTFGSNRKVVSQFAGGGFVNPEVQLKSEDLTKVIAKSVEENVSDRLDKIVNDLERQLLLRPKGVERDDDKIKPDEPVDAEDGGYSTNAGDYKTLLDLISKHESAGAGYNAYNEGGSNGGYRVVGYGGDSRKGPLRRSLTEMTIKEIMAHQKNVNPPIHAAGRYQIIGSTLRGLIEGRYGPTGVNIDDKFSPEVQDKLGIALIKYRLKTGATVENFISEWRGLKFADRQKLQNAINKAQRGKIYRVDTPGVDSKTSLGDGKGNLQLVKQLGLNMGLNITSTYRPGDRGYHGQGRAIDFQTPGASGNRGTPQQMQFAKEIIRRYGSSIRELIYTPLGFGIKNGKKVPLTTWGPLSPPWADLPNTSKLKNSTNAIHYDHVHVAFREGGKVHGLTKAILGEEGPEFVIDADSTKALEKHYPGFLDALNKADYSGALEVIRNYASYESNATIYVDVDDNASGIIPVPVVMPSRSYLMSMSSNKQDYMASAFKR